MNKRTMTLEQCKALLNVIEMRGSKNAKVMDRALVIGLLLVGGEVRTWTWKDVQDKFSTMPTGAYEALRGLATSKKLRLFPFNYEYFRPAHWLGMSDASKPVFSAPPRPSPNTKSKGVFGEGVKPLTTQEVSRRLNRFGRMAGIPDCNLRLLVNTHHLLVELYGDAEAVGEALVLGATTTPLPSASPQIQRAKAYLEGVKKEPRLHGLGRRGGLRTSMNPS